MKILLTLIVSCIFFSGYSQKVTKYYDDTWMESSADKATYYAEFTKTGGKYQCTSYWVAGNILRGNSTYPDTVMAKPIGTQVLYYKNGQTEDSSIDEAGEVKDHYHYFMSGKLSAHYYVPENKTEGFVEGFDEEGKKIKNYIYLREAEFKGGQKAWQQYVIKSVSKDLEIKAEGETMAKVQIQFIVTEDGEIGGAKILESSGYPQIDKDALRRIKDSPVWKGAVMFNNPVKAYRVQPFTYQFVDGKQYAKKS